MLNCSFVSAVRSLQVLERHGYLLMVTVVMAVYNGADYLERQLESIAAQSYKDWRLVIRDDGSSDDTVKVLKDFAADYQDRVYILEDGEPSGSAKNNFAILLEEVSDNEYVMCCDQDDIWMPDKIRVTLDKMLSAEKKFGKSCPVLVHGDVEVVDEDEDVIADSMFSYSNIPPDSTLGQLLVQNNVTGCTMMMNRALISQAAQYLKGDKVIMHDYFAALYAKVFGCVCVVEKPLLKYRQHGDNSVGAKDTGSKGYLLGRLFEGKRQYARGMEISRRQAAFFLDCFGGRMLSEGKHDEHALIKEYAGLSDKGYLRRIYFYMRNGVWKHGMVRRIMQFLWG